MNKFEVGKIYKNLLVSTKNHHNVLFKTDKLVVMRNLKTKEEFSIQPNQKVQRYWEEVKPKHTMKIWVNVYNTKNMSYHTSRQRADSIRTPGYRVACLEIEREYEEGEGL